MCKNIGQTPKSYQEYVEKYKLMYEQTSLMYIVRLV